MAEVSVQGLTIGERLVILRRRLNLTQEDMAVKHNLSRNKYGACERDLANLIKDIPIIDSLADHEKCFLTRRRLGLKQQDVAKKMGITRYWFDQMELGKAPCVPLMEYWS